jgi:hypothetical protein
MKNFSVETSVPAIFVMSNDVTRIVPSMVLSTVITCALITFVPQLMPLWMQLASTPPVN